MNEIELQLRGAGLTENEAKLYSTLLEMGPKTASTLAKKTGMHRRVIYDTADRLIKKGIISYIEENNKKIFQPANPQRILQVIKEKEQAVNTIMPLMTALFEQDSEHPRKETAFFKGINGLKSIFEDQLAEKKEILIVGASPLAYEMLDIYFHWFDKKRIKEKIKAKIIFNKSDEKVDVPLSEIKYLPEKYSSNLAINIYSDRVALILWKKENPLGILIKEQEIADAYRKHFELMWKIAKKS
ncbi:MAG: helix-turn-helix domain-containing protein [Nanoarchaeota archaeon]